MERHGKQILRMGMGGVLAALLLFRGQGALGQNASLGSPLQPLPLKKAAAATELPLGAWGPYSRRHMGICYLANRLPLQLFSFPVVIGQKRAEQYFDPKGKSVLPQNVSLMRRAAGLSPVAAMQDDALSEEEAQRQSNRVATMLEADADGLYWKARMAFAPAALSQRVAASFDANGAPRKATPWGAGVATVEAFPAFTEAEADGLLIRVTLENRSDAPQIYTADLLGGLDTLTSAFTAGDLSVEAGGSAAVVRHAKSDSVFALAARAPYSLRAYRVGDRYFSAEGAVTPRDGQGRSAPFGVIAEEEPHPAAEGAESGIWGLTRVDDIAIEPGQSVTFWFAVGVGKDSETAQRSARTLLLLAEDGGMPGKPQRAGAYGKALAAHNAARYGSGVPALDRLMAQSLANVPYSIWRRVGVPSRMETNGKPGGWYQPEAGGYIALGWVAYRPDFAAAQLNAFFQTNLAADRPSAEPAAVRPSNFAALWELFQQTHDKAMLTAFYPAARRRYHELRDLPREAQDLTRTSDILRTAKMMREFAKRLESAPGEIAEYDRDIEAAVQAIPGGRVSAGLVMDALARQYGARYLQWKDLLDRGEAEKAAPLAAALIANYGPPEAGSDVSGEACVLLALQAAYHGRGHVTAGFDISLWDTHYDSERDSQRVVFRPADAGGKAVLLCVMAKPNADYAVTGAIVKTLHSDANGVLTLTAPADSTTQQIEIVPAGSLK